jgi:biotin carboxyl carrier protein
MSYVIIEREGRSIRLAMARTPAGVWIGWPGGARFFARQREDEAERQGASGEVRSPMTGKIVNVAVSPGAGVAENDLLVILEAMKMEYRLAAPRAGKVEEVLCREGDLVDLGATLVRLVPEDGA